MSKESPNELKIINKNERLKYRLIINELRQQLKENDKLLKCYQEEEKLIADILGDKDLTIIGSRVHLKNLIVELKNKIKDRDIVIEEKDKEIEKLKQQNTLLENENGKLAKELIVKNYKKAKKEVSFGIQLAIQELEKVKELLLDEYKKYPIVYDKTNDIVAGALDRDKVNEIIDQQIKELKGGKDGTNNII